jgi:hypothetical protein
MLGSLVLCSALVSYAVPFRSTLEGMSTKTDNSALACIGRDEYMVPYHVSSLSVSTSRQTYAEMLSAVNTETTFPLVLNFLRCRPSWPTSEKNCLFPDCRH